MVEEVKKEFKEEVKDVDEVVEKPVEVKEKVEPYFRVVDVPTEIRKVIVSKDDKELDVHAALAKILNDLASLKGGLL